MTCTCTATEACLCDERTLRTPLPVQNRPGLPAIRRRVGTHATAKATILGALARPGAGTADLTARNDDDFSVALADAAAVVVDLLSFYTEQAVNEHYLRTATEARSLTELSRLLGYQPQPGLAPVADLAFTLDQTPGAPARSVVPRGTGVQSSPDPGQDPAVYETLADLDANPAWNAIRPRPRVPHPETPGDTLVLAGAVPGVSAGDGVLFRSSPGGAPVFGTVTSVRAVDAVHPVPGAPGSPARTELRLSLVKTSAAVPTGDALPGTASGPRTPASMAWLGAAAVKAQELDAQLLARSVPLEQVAAAFSVSDATPAEALLFRQQRALFGSQAPPTSSLTASVALEASAVSKLPVTVKTWAATLKLPWDEATAAAFPGAAAGDVYLDAAAPAIAVGSLLVLREGDSWGGYRVESAEGVSVAAFGISGRATRVHLGSTTGLGSFHIRRATVFAASERLALADVPASEAIDTLTIELDGLKLGLRAGRSVVVTGSPLDDPGRHVGVPTTLAEVVHDFGPARCTTVTLATRLPDPLARARTTIAANVVPASQGETRREVLGSGDSRRAFPSFLLRQPPLTWLSASTPTGLLSTLSVWVDGVRWTPVESFEGTSPDDAVYVVRREDRGTVVQFGDGITGSRLPTGTANVRAVYRTGSGLGGRVGPGQLSLPTSRAGGVTGVTNPAGSEGGDDPEGVDSVRSSAPLRVLTLGRVVSLADYASFAKAFPGIAKAEAVWARAAAHRGVLLTVAGSRGAVVLPTTGIGAHLLAALAASGDPLVPVALLPYQPRSFRLAAAVKTADNRERDAVLAAVAARLRETFSFSRRGLGQPIAASEVVAEIQAVPGVVACTVTKLWVYSPDGGGAEPSGPPPDFLAAEAPTPGAEIGTVTGAELLVLDAAPIAWAVLS